MDNLKKKEKKRNTVVLTVLMIITIITSLFKSNVISIAQKRVMKRRQ